MKIFLTGACGFIGSHLAESLVKNNFKVKALTYYNSANSIGLLSNLKKNVLKEIEIISGDIRDGEFIKKVSKKVDVIVNLAALVGIPYSYYAPKSYIDTNIYGTYNILNAAKENNISHTIITSTSEVYGSAQEIPIKENHPLNAQSPYAASKIAADQLAMSFQKSYGLPVSIIRPFNTFGPRQSTRAIIPTIITQLLQKKNKNIIKLGNLSPTRDFTYVADTVSAFVKVIKKNKQVTGEIINIGNNFEISIQNILEILKNDFHFNFTIKIEKKRIRKKYSEVERLYASTVKATKILNWQPYYSKKAGFIKALKETIKWYKLNIKNFNYNPNIYNI